MSTVRLRSAHILPIVRAVMVVTFISSTVRTASVVYMCLCGNPPIPIPCNAIMLILFFLMQFLVCPTTGTVVKYFFVKTI